MAALNKIRYKPTDLDESDPKIISWRKPRVYIVGLDDDVRSLFTRYGYITRSGHFTERFDDIDLVCFTGGGDINPRLYGQARGEHTFPDSFRDLEEVKIFHLYPDIPKIGICRGLQLINVLHGGTMIQHVNGHNSGNHDIRDVWGKTLKTSSVHHQMCVPPIGAQVLAWSEDIAFKGKEPEAIFYPETYSLGVQGHPEWGPDPFSEYFMILLKNFVLPFTKYKERDYALTNEKGDIVN